jgi:Tfp pilus assembly protein PilP
MRIHAVLLAAVSCAALHANFAAAEALQTEKPAVPTTLNEIQSKWRYASGLLREFQTITPDGVALNSIRQSDRSITIDGYAKSNESVSALLRNLSKARHINRPELTEIRFVTLDGARRAHFTLNVLTADPRELTGRPQSVGQRTFSCKPAPILATSSEADALLSDINQAGLGRGLQIESFIPNQIRSNHQFDEFGISLIMTGDFADLLNFVDDIRQLPRLITLDNLTLLRTSNDMMTMRVTANIYRVQQESKGGQQTDRDIMNSCNDATKPGDANPFSLSRLDSPSPSANAGTTSTRTENPNRPREPLENHSLDTLQYVGMLNSPRGPKALVLVDKTVYQVSIGNYLGQRSGKVLKITELELVLSELVPDGANAFVERITSMPLQETKK